MLQKRTLGQVMVPKAVLHENSPFTEASKIKGLKCSAGQLMLLCNNREWRLYGQTVSILFGYAVYMKMKV
jgi:hypothetical protein